MKITGVKRVLLTGPSTNDPFLRQCKPGLGIVLTDEIKAKYPFVPGSGEFNSVPGKVLME